LIFEKRKFGIVLITSLLFEYHKNLRRERVGHKMKVSFFSRIFVNQVTAGFTSVHHARYLTECRCSRNTIEKKEVFSPSRKITPYFAFIKSRLQCRSAGHMGRGRFHLPSTRLAH
jgi:hypothetical protein